VGCPPVDVHWLGALHVMVVNMLKDNNLSGLLKFDEVWNAPWRRIIGPVVVKPSVVTTGPMERTGPGSHIYYEAPIRFLPTYKKKIGNPSSPLRYFHTELLSRRAIYMLRITCSLGRNHLNRNHPCWIPEEFSYRHKLQWYKGGYVKDRTPAVSHTCHSHAC